MQYCDARGSDEACDVNVLVDLAPGANTLIVKTAEGDGEGKEALRLTVVRALRLLCNASRLTCDGDACAPLGCVVGPGGSNLLEAGLVLEGQEAPSMFESEIGRMRLQRASAAAAASAAEAGQYSVAAAALEEVVVRSAMSVLDEEEEPFNALEV